MARSHLLVAAILLGVFASAAWAEDAYYQLPATALTITEGTLPGPATQPAERYLRPYAVLDGAGEVYATETGLLNICAPAGQPLAGRLYLPKPDNSGLVTLRFKAADAKPAAENRTPFLERKLAHYRDLIERDTPGAAWFRYQERLTAKQLGVEPANRELNNFGRGTDEVDRTFGLFSAGRAVSENLQLDRALRPSTAPAEAKVDLSSIEGITIREFDWKPLVKDAKPLLDPLAALIPADQHAIFFPTFEAMTTLADEADRQGTPLMALAEPQSQDARVKERYQKQLCLSMTAVGRLLGPRIISSVAFTGSDPYLRMGSDVAVIFEAKDLNALQTLLAAQVALAQNAQAVAGDVDGIAYTGAVSTDRSICSYRAAVGNSVVVTNSLAQLKAIVAVSKGSAAALASLPEYTFFRNRYQRGDAEETALMVLSDAAIRRWCSPRWRIADSRRARAAAVMSQLQAENLDAGGQKPQALELASRWDVPELGKLQATNYGVVSSTYGTLEFMTPVVELPADKVTVSERDAYVRWRDSYQRNWRWSFDPIAARITINDKKLAADVTVMPLIASTEYSEMIAMSRGARIGPGSGDPHDALAHWAMAINRDSDPVRRSVGVLGMHIDPLSWLGQTVAVYADDDPFWAELAKQPPAEQFLEKQFHRLPVALYAEVRSPLKLTAFLLAIRGLAHEAAPGMITWETLTYRDQPYVKISPTPAAVREMAGMEQVRVYYVPTPDAIVVSLREEMVQRFIDRQIDRGILSSTQPSTAPKAAQAPTTLPWLGESAALQVQRRFADAMADAWRPDYLKLMQGRAWANIPILNEWHRLYPNEDPVKLHERLWQVRLVCPGGGSYVWNEPGQTMESTIYGSPGQPKAGPTTLPWAGLKNSNFGLTFENDGVRARTVLERE